VTPERFQQNSDTVSATVVFLRMMHRIRQLATAKILNYWRKNGDSSDGLNVIVH
jgi:hypothetical protein